ncbi:MAG TPA: hypothetical protein VMW17_23655 [Candidatus Binatia bacterium]|nr:hypothetical protein [Candidatus Binatia bacterium]
MSDQRGVALIITLLVLTLLTITVVEFTYSVTVDYQLANNAMTAMQAQLLARAGINFGEALLARDTNQPPADWYFEDWAHPDVASLLPLDPGDRLEVRVIDESGKINVNRTRSPRGAPLAQPGQPNLSPDAFLRDALRRLFEANDVDVQIPDRLLQYWGQTLPPVPGQQPNQPVDDFRSIEDFAAMFGISGSKLVKLRHFITAIPSSLTVGGRGAGDLGRINVNTAPAQVLAAVINDQGRVQSIMERQGQEQPIDQAIFNGIMQGLQNEAQIKPLFGFTSAFFRVCASAQVSGDPTGQRPGGVGQTVVALVNRRPLAGVPANAAPGIPRWTLTPLDWQKRGGAALLTRTPLSPDSGSSLLDRDAQMLDNGPGDTGPGSTPAVDACS